MRKNWLLAKTLLRIKHKSLECLFHPIFDIAYTINKKYIY